MIKNIIFDLGNVVVCFDHDTVVSPFTNNPNEIEFLKTQVIPAIEWKKIDDGSITEEQAWQSFKDRFNEDDYKLAVDFSQNWYKKHPLNSGAVEIAKKLKNQGFNLYVVSNIGTKCFEYIKEHNEEFFSMFDGLIISAKEKVRKPDPKIFEILIDRYNIEPTETLLIDDDDTGRTFNTANQMGINGCAVKKNDAQSILDLLKQYNIVV